jgi:hypothetical protein
MWGQGAQAAFGGYDADDDRMVIAALSSRRVGFIRRPDLRSGTGLQIIVPAWLGVCELADGTSMVLGNRNESNFTIAAGPASGSRVDYLWADPNPATGTYALALLSQGALANRIGLLLATITAPAGANTAAAMSWVVPGLTFGGAGGLLARAVQSDNVARSSTTFAAAADIAQTAAVQCYAGRVYRVEGWTAVAGYSANVAGGQGLRCALNRAPGANQLGFATSDWFETVDQRRSIRTQFVGTIPAGVWQFSTRWFTSGGSFRTDYSTGQGVIVTVEDLGPTHLTLS